MVDAKAMVAETSLPFLKSPRIELISAKLLREEGTLEIYQVTYRKGTKPRPYYKKFYKEGIMVYSNGVYGLGKTVKSARRSFMRKIGFI